MSSPVVLDLFQHGLNEGNIKGLVQDYSNSIANALELLQSCTKPLISPFPVLRKQAYTSCDNLSICPNNYRKISNIRRALVGNIILDHSDVVGASPVGAAPTTSLFST